MSTETQQLMCVGNPVTAHDLADAMRDRELPVRVIDGEHSQVIHLPIGQWGVMDLTAVRSLVQALGWKVSEREPIQDDPDGCVIVIRRLSS